MNRADDRLTRADAVLAGFADAIRNGSRAADAIALERVEQARAILREKPAPNPADAEGLRARLLAVADACGTEEADHEADLREAARLLAILDRIHEAMDGEEWDSDTTGHVGDLLTGAGFTINPPGHYEDEDEEE